MVQSEKINVLQACRHPFSNSSCTDVFGFFALNLACLDNHPALAANTLPAACGIDMHIRRKGRLQDIGPLVNADGNVVRLKNDGEFLCCVFLSSCSQPNKKAARNHVLGGLR